VRTRAGELHQRRVLAIGLGLLTACRPGPEVPAAIGGARPNVVLISLDTLRADRLNAYGYTVRPTSPHIDALAGDGILHTAHIAASPWTTPSHMSLLTSMHPSSHGVISSFGELNAGLHGGAPFVRLAGDRVTLAEALLEEGYRTAAYTGGGPLHPSIGFDQGFEEYSSTMYKVDEAGMGEMLDWIDRDDRRPFFLFWHTFEVHAPYLHPDFLPDSLAAVADEVLALHADDVEDDRRHVAARTALLDLLKAHDAFLPWVSSTLYDGAIASADAWVGRLLSFLRERGLYDSTLIVLTSDHGEEFADRDPARFYDQHGRSAYDEMIRVPLILKLPDSRHAGLAVDGLSRAIDVMPTVLGVAAVHAPAEQMQGDDLAPLWSGGAARSGRVAFTEGTAAGDELKSLRTESHKLILEIAMDRVREQGRAFVPETLQRVRLFDLRSDPGERSDLLAAPAAAEAELAAALEARVREIVGAASAEVEAIELDAQTLRELEALGYLGR